MKPQHIVFVVVAIVVIACFSYVAHSILHLGHEIPESAAGLDTATMLMVYMQSHDDHWPTSWDDLITVVDAQPGKELTLRGAQTNTLAYAQTLRKMVAVNWAFDPSQPNASNPITRPDGTPLPIVWSGGDPNKFIRDFLRAQASTRVSAATQP
jgi:hypothetical protein